MPCGGCEAARKAREARAAAKFVYVAPDGTRTEKPTEVEALAMKIRAGHVGTVEPK